MRRSFIPELRMELPGILADEVEDAPLMTLAASAVGRRGIAGREPKSRSKTSRGSISLAIGRFADFQEMFDE